MVSEHFTGLNELSRHTSKHCWPHFSFKNQIKYLKTLYLRRVARTCIFDVQVGTALIVLIRGLCPKAHVIATSYLFPVLQNWKIYRSNTK